MTTGRTALITGITGQDGSYLARFLLDRDYTVYGLFARRAANTLWRLRDLGVETRVRLIDGDLTDLSSIVHAMEQAQPEEVYNLAAQSMVATSWKQPLLTGHVTALGVVWARAAIQRCCVHKLRNLERKAPSMSSTSSAPTSTGSSTRRASKPPGRPGPRSSGRGG